MAEQIPNVVESQKNGVAVLKIKGKLDSSVSPELEKRIFQYLNQGTKKLLLNFADVIYISSTGMRMLLSVKHKIKTYQGKLIVCSLSNEALEMMKICGFDHVLEITASEEDALRRFKEK